MRFFFIIGLGNEELGPLDQRLLALGDIDVDVDRLVLQHVPEEPRATLAHLWFIAKLQRRLNVV